MIIQVDILTLKNTPVTREEREQSEANGSPFSGKESDEYSLFFKVQAEVDGKEYVGLGEARPSDISSENLSRATRYAKKLARGLVGKALPAADGDEGYAQQVHNVVQSVVSDI